jgi:hypothetical protein
MPRPAYDTGSDLAPNEPRVGENCSLFEHREPAVQLLGPSGAGLLRLLAALSSFYINRLLLAHTLSTPL